MQTERAARTGLAHAAVAVVGAVVLAGCGALGGALGPTPSATGSPGASSTASPGASDTASPNGSASPSDTASPSAGETTGPSGSPEPGQSGSPSTGTSGSPSAAPLSCTDVTPVRIQKVSAEPRRTIEVVTLVSDGRNLTPGTREQSEFAQPTLTAPDGSPTTDETTSRKIADLIEGSSKNRVLLTRPDPPDTGADAGRRPYNSPGTYVAYNATSPLTADVIVTCFGQEQRWQFTAESDLTTGQVNCAVEPPKSNAVARLVYTNNC
jgi:hypothetical protein